MIDLTGIRMRSIPHSFLKGYNLAMGTGTRVSQALIISGDMIYPEE